MRFILIAAGVIGCFLGYNLMLGKASPDWPPTTQTVFGGAVVVGSAVSFVVGLATCDIVQALRRGDRKE